jgi:hypothetical protein
MWELNGYGQLAVLCLLTLEHSTVGTACCRYTLDSLLYKHWITWDCFGHSLMLDTKCVNKIVQITEVLSFLTRLKVKTIS